jgi:Zn-dependent protease
MTPTRQGSIRLFRFAGIDLYLHWSWFAVAAFVITNRGGRYSSLTWNVLEYLTLFLIVLLHEFGHALACRQVGGRANQIVLWPLGGVAYVDPPPRPGATLWSIAAGPLVNVALLPVLGLLWILSGSLAWPEAMPNAYAFIQTLFFINLGLLIFNLLPIYPLDGGQILRCLLWFVLGRARSLMAATIIGLAGLAVLIGLAVLARSRWSVWLTVVTVFILLNCWRGLLQARALSRLASAPRHEGLACPACQAAPPRGAFWLCGQCRKSFDTFVTQAACPHCGAQFAVTRCLDCGGLYPMGEWMAPAVAPPRI